ncbi:unnamed protein product [Caenorhabditis angaria]|uniref:Uncharacterized protein n=1 Tax=Caenorhabditis angaria TaxID=860376 RepID=A0A9P1J7R5_9PELO|nr:unnamed protein product [Caenorhabditis angaria]
MTNSILFLTILLVCASCILATSFPILSLDAGENAEFDIGNSKEFKRTVGNGSVQVYRICNGKNAKTCGYWEDIKTKKKVAKAPVTKKVGKNLILEKVTEADSGSYYNDGQIYYNVHVLQKQG